MDKEKLELIKREGWELVDIDGVKQILAFAQTFPIDAHPFSIYGKLYREEDNPEMKFTFMKRLHDMLWPQDIDTWHSWTEERFRTWCEGWRVMSWASGASGAKSTDAAKIIILEFFAAPKTTGAIIASTTINSLQSRIYGYALRYLRDMRINLPYTLMRSQPPKILYNRDDEIHCISALAAAKGGDSDAIKNYIGRHPKGKLILALDEAPDLDPCILQALPNLEAGKENNFQCIVIGNSLSKFDLHGVLSTPKNGWNSIDPKKDTRWETTQNRGICLFFSCYNSPAVHEQDPVKKALLSKFLIDAETIEAKKKIYGEHSDSFWRFVLGFWRDEATDDLVISSAFLSEFHVKTLAEWSGMYPLQIVGGLDPAFSTGGDQCLFRLAILGHEVSGRIVLDFRKEELLFRIKIVNNIAESAELQIAKAVIKILKEYNASLSNIAIDATGQGRAIGEVIRLQARVMDMPIKIYSVRMGNTAVKSFDVVVRSSLELWTDVRDFVQTDQIRGLDETAIRQFTSRLIKVSGNGKRTLESKAEYKSRMGSVMPSLAHSPDEADAVSLCLQAAKLKFGFVPGQRRDVGKVESFELEKWHAALMAQAQEESHTPIKQSFVATCESDLSEWGSVTDPLFKQG